MNYDLENFVEISQLNPAECSALQKILAQKEIMAMAEVIAEKAFMGEKAEDVILYPESTQLSQAWFAAAFLSFEASHRHYMSLNYPEAVWRDSMTDLKVWLRNEFRNSGVIGLGKLARPWQVVLYRGSVTRHGRLECNSSFFYSHGDIVDPAGKTLLRNGDAVINLHIPEEGPMDMDSCGISLKRMAKFFAECRSDYKWQGFLCESWLLDRQLRQMLPENSNIIKFQDLGFRFMLHESDDTIFRIFGYSAPESIKNPTSLQRNAAEFLKRGGKFFEEGIFIPRALIGEFDFDLNKLLAYNRQTYLKNSAR